MTTPSATANDPIHLPELDGKLVLALLSAADAAQEIPLLGAALRGAVKLLGERGSCILVDDMPRLMITTEAPSVRERPIDLGRYPEVKSALERREVVVVEDAQADTTITLARGAFPRALPALAVVPLFAGDRALGALLVRAATAAKMTRPAIETALALGRLTGHLLEATRLRRGDPGELLPTREETHTPTEVPRVTQFPQLTAHSRRRILVIEDDANHTSIVTAVLQRRGYHVEQAHDGADGVERARRSPPDLILLDVCMPDLDGFATAQQLKADARTRDVPILFVSACDDVATRVRGIELGAADYLSKPFYAPELLARVERSLGQVETRERLRAQAHIDELTGLGNLRHLRERMAIEQSRTSRYGTALAVVMIDLDKLKHINDNFGHPAGNQAIVSVARVLRDEIRETDVAARYGGDEFVVILPHATLDDGVCFAERVAARIRGLGPAGVPLTASFGVAANDGTMVLPAEVLIEQADRAAYRAKRKGGDAVCTLEDPSTTTPDSVDSVSRGARPTTEGGRSLPGISSARK